MAKPITTPFTFQTQAGPIPLSQLDTDFSTAAAAINDFATYSNFLTDTSGAPNQITVTVPVGLTFSYSAGVKLEVLLANTTTSTAVQINVSGLGNKAVQNIDGTVPAIGQLVAGMILQLQFNGTVFLLTGSASKPPAAGAVTSITGTANQIAASASTGAVTLSIPQNVILPTPATGAALIANAAAVSAAGDRAVSIAGTSTDTRLGVASTTSGNAQLNLDTNGVQNWVISNVRSDGSFRISSSQTPGSLDRLIISTSGNLTVPAPTSGAPITLQRTGDGDSILLQRTGVTSLQIGFGDAFLAGQAEIFGVGTVPLGLGTVGASPVHIYANGTLIQTLTNGGGVQIGAPTGGDQGVGTLNATGLLVNGVSVNVQSGSFTGTCPDITGSPTATVFYSISGNNCTLSSQTSFNGTSNGTAFTITGAPVQCRPARNEVIGSALISFTDNGTACGGSSSVATSGTITFVKLTVAAPFTGTTWTGSGTKASGSFCITYPLN